MCWGVDRCRWRRDGWIVAAGEGGWGGAWGVERRVDLDVRLAPASSSRYLCDGGLVLVLQPGLLLVRTHLNIFFKHTVTFHFYSEICSSKNFDVFCSRCSEKKTAEKFSFCSEHCFKVGVKPMLVPSMWIKKAQLPCWPSRGRQVSHQSWNWGIHSIQAKGSTLTLKPRADITRSPK